MIFDKQWFKQHQKILLFFLNTPIIRIWFRYVLCINGDRSSVDNLWIEEIYPHAIRWKNKDNTETIEFRTHNKFAKRLYFAFKPLWEIIHFWDTVIANNFFPQLNLGFDSLTFYPDPGTGVTTVDGILTRLDTGTSNFTDLRDGAGTSAAATGSSGQGVVLQAQSPTTDTWRQINRSIFTFDTSSLPDTTTLLSASLSLYGTSSGASNGLGSTYMHIAASSPASNNTLVAADYSQIQRTSFGSIYYDSFSTSGYNAISLDSNGIANITKTGISKFSAQIDWDINNSAPTWVSGGSFTAFSFFFADNTGTSKDPKLTVTYSAAPTVTTDNASNITRTTALLGGNVTSDGGAAISERGIVYSTSSNPTTSDGKKIVAGTTGAYAATVTNLSPNTLYHVRAYAINDQGTSYGSDKTFTTLNTPLKIPVLRTGKVTNVRRTRAFVEGEVLTDGDATITERGFCWSTGQNPTTSDSKIVIAGTTGIFSSDIQVLTQGTTYYVRSYAINSVGTAYGPAVRFITPTKAVPKHYYYKVFDTDTVTYITTWSQEVISSLNFSQNINSGPGECIIRLSRSFDDFGEDDDVTLNNKVEVWVVDEDAHDGKLLYSGYISGYRPVIDGVREYVEVTLFPYSAELARFILTDSDGNTTFTYNSYDPAVMLRDVLDKFRSLGGHLQYTTDSIINTGAVASYTFNTVNVKEALDKILELCPVGWYYRIDADNIVYLNSPNATGDHNFKEGDDAIDIMTFKRIEDLVNRVLVVGGGSPQLYRQYQDVTSQQTYGLYEERYVDERITSAVSAQIIAQRILASRKDPETRCIIRLMDSNGVNVYRGYDIESVKPGQTLKFIDFEALTTVVQILSVQYYSDFAMIEASSRLPQVAKRVEDIKRNLTASLTVDNPSVPS